MGSTEPKSGRLNLRLTPSQETVVRRAAEASGESITEYVVRHVVDAAENDLADQRVFVLDDAGWVEFQAMLNRPPVHRPQLEKLLTSPSVFEQDQP